MNNSNQFSTFFIFFLTQKPLLSFFVPADSMFLLVIWTRSVISLWCWATSSVVGGNDRYPFYLHRYCICIPSRSKTGRLFSIYILLPKVDSNIQERVLRRWISLRVHATGRRRSTAYQYHSLSGVGWEYNLSWRQLEWKLPTMWGVYFKCLSNSD